MRQMAHNWGLTFSGAWMLSQRPDGQPSDVENCRIVGRGMCRTGGDGPGFSKRNERGCPRGNPSRNEDNFYCKAGKAAFVINPSGDMNACLLLPVPAARPLGERFSGRMGAAGQSMSIPSCTFAGLPLLRCESLLRTMPCVVADGDRYAEGARSLLVRNRPGAKGAL